MATLEQLYDALKNADAAGAADDARTIADEIVRRKAMITKPEGSGVLENLAAGTKDFAYGLAGAPVNVASTVINTLTQPDNPVSRAAVNIPGIGPIISATQQGAQALNVPAIPDNTIGSSRWLAEQGEKVGIVDPAKVEAVTPVEKIVRAGTEAALYTAAPELLLAKLKSLGIVGEQATRLAESMLGDAKSGAAVTRNALTGGAAGATAEMTQDNVPEQYRPLAAILGSLVGGTFGALAEGATRRTLGAAAQKVGEFTDPMRGAAGVERTAARRLAAGLDAAPEETIAAIDAAGPAPSGAPRTLAEVTGDRGAATMQAAAKRTDAKPFEDLAARQAQEQAAALKRIQTTGGASDMAPALEAHARRVDDLLTRIDDVAQARGQRIATDLSAGRLDDVTAGEQMRGLLQDQRDATRRIESTLYKAVDPDKTLVGTTRNLGKAHTEITGEASPLSKPLTGEPKAITEAISALPEQVPFSDLVALKERITTAMREERRAAGKSGTWRQLSQYNNAIRQDINAPIRALAKEQASAVKAGTLAPEDTWVAKIRQINDELDRHAAAFGTLDEGAGGVRAGAEAAGPGRAGTAGAVGGEPAGTPGGAGVPAGAGARPLTITKKNGEEYLNTRGKGQQYHGSSSPLSAFDEGHYNGANIYGNGFYTTDAVDVATGYQKKGGGSNPHLYTVTEKTPLTFANMDAPIETLPKELVDYIKDDEMLGTAYDSLGESNPTLREVMDELRHISAGEGWSRDTVHESFETVREILANHGFGGMTHVGGSNTGALPHQVKIYFRPETDVSLQPVSPKSFQNTFDEGAARRLARANEVTIQRVNTFDTGLHKQALARPSDTMPYTMRAEQFPGKVFAKGPTGGVNVMNYRSAVGDAAALPVLEGHAIDSVVEAAARPDGTLDPRKITKWRSDHSEALRSFPALDARLTNATTASETAARVAAARRAKVDASQKSVAASLAGVHDPAELTARIGAIFKRADGVTQMQKLRRSLRGDPDALNGLRRAVVDHIEGLAVEEAKDLGGKTINGARLATFIRDNTETLRAAGFTDPEIKQMAALGDEAARAAEVLRSARPAPNKEALLIQDILHLGAESRSSPTSLLLNVAVRSAIHSALPTALGGPLAGAVTFLGAAAVNALRAKGLQHVDELFHEALLDPDLAKRLLKTLTPKNAKPVVNAFRQQVMRSALGGALAANTTPGGRPDPMGIR